MGRKLSEEQRRKVEKDIRNGMKVNEIAARHGVSVGYVYKVQAFRHPLAISRPVEAAEPEELPAIQRNPACRGCYWGKPAGHKITCFWQKCRKGGRV